MRFEKVYITFIVLLSYIWSVGIHVKENASMFYSPEKTIAPPNGQKTVKQISSDYLKSTVAFLYKYVLTYIYWIMKISFVIPTYGLMKGISNSFNTGKNQTTMSTATHLFVRIITFSIFVLCATIFFILVLMNNLNAWLVLIIVAAFLSLFIYMSLVNN